MPASPWRLAGPLLALLGAATPAAQAQSSPPSPLRADEWPPGLPVGEMAGWQSFRGAYATDVGQVAYELFVDPVRIGLYRVTRYRVTPPAGGGAQAAVAMDTVQFVARPGQAPPLCYQRPASAGPKGPWLMLVQGTPAYNGEMWRGIEVFQRQQKAHRDSLEEGR
jgi:hypothetical protein